MQNRRQNLTLTLDPDLLKAARRVALERDTTVNQLVREYLVKLTSDQAAEQEVELEKRRKRVEALEEIFRTTKAEMGPITWKREDLYDRGRK